MYDAQIAILTSNSLDNRELWHGVMGIAAGVQAIF